MSDIKKAISFSWEDISEHKNVFIECYIGNIFAYQDESGIIYDKDSDSIITEYTIIDRRPVCLKPIRADDEFDYINWDVVPELSNVLVECNLGRVYAVQHTNGTCIDGLTGAEIKDYRVLASRPGTQHETPFSVPKEQLARAITDKSGITEPETASIETDCLSVWQSFTETDLSAITSQRILAEACETQVSRGVTYDSPKGERSMGKTVAMFNIHTGFNLTEEQGWQFMELLKMVRSGQGDFKLDNYVDGTSYASLAGEAAARDRGNNS